MEKKKKITSYELLEVLATQREKEHSYIGDTLSEVTWSELSKEQKFKEMFSLVEVFVGQEIKTFASLYNVASPLLDCLEKLEKEGANIGVIFWALIQIPRKRQRKTGTYDMNLDLSEDSAQKARNEVSAKKRNAMNAIATLTERFSPISSKLPGSQINMMIGKMQDEMKTILAKYDEVRKHYFELKLIEKLLPLLEEKLSIKFPEYCSTESAGLIFGLMPPDKIESMVRKTKAANRSERSLWNESISGIVGELKKIKYSEKKAFVETSKLLHSMYPNNFELKSGEDFEHDLKDLVRQRYKSHSKKLRLESSQK